MERTLNRTAGQRWSTIRGRRLHFEGKGNGVDGDELRFAQICRPIIGFGVLRPSSSRLQLLFSLGTLLLSAQPGMGTPGHFEPTGSLTTPRGSPTATLFPNGKVLVVGGDDSSGSFASAELYDTATGAWTSTGSLAFTQQGHTATLLANGKVLVTLFGCPFLVEDEPHDIVFDGTSMWARMRATIPSVRLLPQIKSLTQPWQH